MSEFHFCILPKRVAKDRGFKHYFTGKPCKHGHFSNRATNGGACVDCKHDRYLNTRDQYLEQKRQEYAEKRRNSGHDYPVRAKSKGIKHSEFVGKSITTNHGAVLVVVGHNGKSGNASRHTFYCSECAKDSEMFGDGRFVTNINNITHSGTTPCGCSPRARWTEWQYYIRAKRAAISRGYRFYGWSEKFKGWKTKLSIYCPDHGALKNSTPTSLIVVGQGCRKCYDLSIRERAPSDKEVEEKYLEKCGYPNGSRIKRLDEEGGLGTRNRFEVWCPVCASDEYSEAGLCNGVFYTTIESLSSGYCSCRCGGGTRKKEQSIAEFQIISICYQSGADFLGWVDGYANSRSKAIIRCPEHGDYHKSASCILIGQGCPWCSGRKRMTDDHLSKRIVEKNGMPEGSSAEKVSEDLVRVYCSCCSNDEYVESGACTGVFESSYASILSGAKPCRCSGSYVRPEPVAAQQMDTLLKEKGAHYIGWEGEYNGSLSIVRAKCNIHGEWTTRFWSIITGQVCPRCSRTGYNPSKDGYLYLLKSEEGDRLKIGITNYPEERFKKLKRETPFGFSVLECLKMDGEKAPIREREILNGYERSGLSGFDGATEWLVFNHRVLEEFR